MRQLHSFLIYAFILIGIGSVLTETWVVTMIATICCVVMWSTYHLLYEGQWREL